MPENTVDTNSAITSIQEYLKSLAGSPAVYAKFLLAISTYNRKNLDYATREDPFLNFRSCEALGIPAHMGIFVRLGDKWSRICNLVKKGQHNRAIRDESLQDTLLDLAVYAIIVATMLDDNSDTTDGQEVLQ